MASLVAVFDKKGRVVHQFPGGNVDWYEGRYTKKMGREAIASYLDMEWEVEGVFSEKDVQLVRDEEVDRRTKEAPEGGSHLYVAVENVPKAKALHLRAVYAKYLPESTAVASPEIESPDIIRTDGEEDEDALKRVMIRYFASVRDWHVELDEIHFISGQELERLREEAQAEGYDW